MQNNKKNWNIFYTDMSFCNLAKEWFKEKGLSYEEYDVDQI